MRRYGVRFPLLSGACACNGRKLGPVDTFYKEHDKLNGFVLQEGRRRDR